MSGIDRSTVSGTNDNDNGSQSDADKSVIGSWRASQRCRGLRWLGAGLLTVSVVSLAAVVVPLSPTVDFPGIAVDEPSLQAVTRGIVVGLVLLGNGELAGRITAAGAAIRDGLSGRSR